MTTNPSPKTLQDHLKALGGAALLVGAVFVLLEILLQLLDPWGLRYFDDLLRMGNEIFITDSQRGYIMPDGDYHFSKWSTTIANGTRRVPATQADAACTLVLLGDSVTFAHGVNDADTWANRLAEANPTLNIINTGMTTYNSYNAWQNQQAFEANAYLYVLVYNDIEGTLNPDPEAFPNQNPTRLPQLVRYTNFAMFGRKPSQFNEQVLPPADDANYQRFLTDIQAIMSNEKTFLVAFEGSPLNPVIQGLGYELAVYPYPAYQNSFVDNHWNAEGNRVFAEQIQPLAQEIIDNSCLN